MQSLFLRARALMSSIATITVVLIALTIAPGTSGGSTASAYPLSPEPVPGMSAAPSGTPVPRAKVERAKRERAKVKKARAAASRKARKQKRKKLTGKKKAGFIWPVNGPITSRFGRRVIFGHVEPHRGMDIGCSGRHAIKAAKAGRVIFLQRRNPIYGKIAVIAHHKGYSTLYSHMRRMRIDVGDRVRKGETIGKCGSTGRATGPHLHFEIRRNGRHLNPRPYLNRR